MGKRSKMGGSAASVGVLFLCFVLTLSQSQGETEEKSGERGARIFYVTTTSSVTTINTNTFCYLATTVSFAVPTCAKKRRRSLKIINEHGGAAAKDILPSRSDIEPDTEIESSQGEQRQGKFVNYWITTTSTSFTATSTIASVACSPVGWTYNVCPGAT